jgi:hypothetical protein
MTHESMDHEAAFENWWKEHEFEMLVSEKEDYSDCYKDAYKQAREDLKNEILQALPTQKEIEKYASNNIDYQMTEGDLMRAIGWGIYKIQNILEDKK